MNATAPSTALGASAPGFAARLYDAHKVYGTGDQMIHALNAVTVGFPTGRFTAVMGPSGSGKSTLVQCASGLDALSHGRAFIGDTELTGLNAKALTDVRRRQIGFVFQSFNLLPNLTAEANIRLPSKLAGAPVDDEQVQWVAKVLGIADRLHHRPKELSGGQQQRVAVARALVGRPDLLVGDEPTGNLDSKASGAVLDLLRTAVDQWRQTVVIVTHDPVAAARADQVLFMADGSLVDSIEQPTVDRVIEQLKRLGS